MADVEDGLPLEGFLEERKGIGVCFVEVFGKEEEECACR